MPSLLDKPARRLGHAEHPEEESDGRDGADGEHDAPDPVDVAERVPEDRVDHERRELSDDDGDLVAPRDGSADLERRELREEDGHHRGCAADGESEHDAPNNQEREVGGDDDHDGAEEEHDREDQDGSAATDCVRDAPTEESAESRGEHQGARDDSFGEGVEADLGGHRTQGAVDDAGVVAEEEAAEARDDGDQAEALAVRPWGQRW